MDECADRREKLENAFTSYSSILELYGQVKEMQTWPAEYLAVEELYDQCTGIARKLQRRAAEALTKAATNLGTGASSVANKSSPEDPRKGFRLPPVIIPPFQGEVDKWRTFYDLFSALIDKNTSLSEVEKLYYLKSFLKEEPLQLIDSLSLTNQSYRVAIGILRDRYENRSSIINALLRQLIDLKAISKPTAAALREFSTSITQTLGSLKAMSLPIDSWDVILVFLICRKLDYGTHRAFELEQPSGDKYATMKELQQFIDKRALALENLEIPPAGTVKATHGLSRPVSFNCLDSTASPRGPQLPRLDLLIRFTTRFTPS